MSEDHYILRAPGRISHTKGKSYTSEMFAGRCGFIDHASGYMSIKNQVAIKATETLKEKLTFEREAQSQGVFIKRYQTYNVISNASEFLDEMLKNQQKS